MKKLTDDVIRTIEQRMFNLKGKAAKAMATQLAAIFDVDITRIYHYSKDVRPQRKTRADKNIFRGFASDEELLKDVLALTIKGDFDAEHITRLIKHNKGIDVPAATIRNVLRKFRQSRRENKLNLKPYRSWEAEYPNQLHQIDTTVSQQFYLATDGSFGYDEYYYKNKDTGKKPRLVLFQLVDDHSRVKFAMFVLNNNAHAWLHALYHAWRKKPDWPFYGIPEILYSDNDSVIKSKVFKQTMRYLGRGAGMPEGIKVLSHDVGNSQAKGKVEGGFKLLQEFEKITKVCKFSSLEEANAALWDFLYGYNCRRHSTTKEMPFARWLRVSQDRLVNMPDPELFNRLQYTFVQRQLRRDVTISLNGKVWQLPQKRPFVNFVGKYIDIACSPYDDRKIYVILENKDYEIEHADKSVHPVGEFKRPEASIMEQIREEIEDRSLPDWEYSGFYQDMYGKDFIKREGQEFDAENSGAAANPVMRNRIWFTTRLQELLILDPEHPPSADERAFIDRVFGAAEELPEAELNAVISKIQSGEISLGLGNAGVA